MMCLCQLSIQKADSLDILVVLTGYILMHVTFMRLFLSSRALGSNFWLSTGIFSSAIISFLFTLPLCRSLDIPLDPIALTEALPFLVCTVGFDKPLRLARAVMAHPHMLKPQEDGRMKPAGNVILEALDRVGNVILRDYALEIAVLFVGVNSRVGGLKEFCAVAAVALAMDCLMTFTLYTAVLTIMVEVRDRIFVTPALPFCGPARPIADGAYITTLPERPRARSLLRAARGVLCFALSSSS